ncbi:hypothetical protein [Croceitalea sp. MTPC5]|uniref:hypothetical protein n=1 Tax=Croceitalea sp. MTPC5 TaxID=3056565 RepID=UPI0030D5258A
MINIFIGLSQYHVDLFENFLLQRTDFQGKSILITGKEIAFNKEKWHKHIELSNGVKNQSKSQVSRLKSMTVKLRAYKGVIKHLEKYKSEKRINLVFSSLEDVLSNYLFFYFSKNIKGLVVEDGVLNYYNHTIRCVPSSVLLLKKTLTLLFGLNFKFYSGHTSGINYDKTLFQYVREPSFSVAPNKSKKIPYKPQKLELVNSKMLIIGQEPYANLDERKYQKHLNLLFEKIKLDEKYMNVKKIMYKPHRHGPRLKIDTLREYFKEKDFEYVTTDLSAEKYFFEVAQCRNLVTFDSSAVFNIYSQCDFETRKKLKISVLPFLDNELTALFEQLGFYFYKK